MAFVSAGDIFKLFQSAFKLWEYSFSKAPKPGQQYTDFGNNIKDLAENLKNLSNVIQDVTEKVPSFSAQERKWNLKTLPKICGDFEKTLHDCQKLLRDENKFSRDRGGFIYNIQWDSIVKPEVTRLKDRVAFHNIKITAILEPLKLKLFHDLKSDIQNLRLDVTDRLTNIQDLLNKLYDHCTGKLIEASRETTTLPSAVFEVPQYLQDKFEAAVRAANSAPQDETKFSLVKGVDAFHHHFQQVKQCRTEKDQNDCKFEKAISELRPEPTSVEGDGLVEQTPQPLLYLNLMKSIWVIQKVKKGEKYTDAATDPLWHFYIQDLERKCHREFQSITEYEQRRKRLFMPTRENLELLGQEEFHIWLDDDDDDDEDGEEAEFQPSMGHSEQIFKVHIDSYRETGPILASKRLLPDPPHQKLELVLLRRNEFELVMQVISSGTIESSNRQPAITDVNLKDAVLGPLYANPVSPRKDLRMTLKGAASSARTSVLGFSKLTNILDFQQAITGYKVVYDEINVHLLTHRSKIFSKGKQTFERGRVQMWNPRPLTSPSPSAQDNDATRHHRNSVITTASNAPSSEKSFTTNFTSPVQTGGSSSVSFQKPGVPILVFFVVPVNGEELSFLTLEMDPETVIKNDSCGCNMGEKNCIHVTIESSGSLVGRQIKAAAAGENQGLNLAMLGTFQAPKRPDLVKNLSYIQIDFETPEQRLKFTDRFEETKEIYKRRLCAYYEDMRRARGTHTV